MEKPLDSDLQAFAESHLVSPKALQELPLILIPDYLFQLSPEVKRRQPIVQTALQKWLDHARLDDERLRIERRFIPYTPIYIPDTYKGRHFFQVAQAIGNIPTLAPVVPKNPNQAYWLKTLHYFWQAKGVILAEKILGFIPDLLIPRGVLDQRLPATSLDNLDLLTNIDLASLRLLVRGRRAIQRWAKDDVWAREQAITYTFHNPFELLVEILRQDFLVGWELGPRNPDSDWKTKQWQREAITNRIFLLKEIVWQNADPDNVYNQKRYKEYLGYLKEAEWSGYWILALQSQLSSRYSRHLEPYLEAYLKALVKGKELFVDEFDWRGGNPYKKQVNGQQVTNSARQLRVSIDFLGYILWCWS